LRSIITQTSQLATAHHTPEEGAPEATAAEPYTVSLDIDIVGVPCDSVLPKDKPEDIIYIC
jgi:hypothetical protein